MAALTLAPHALSAAALTAGRALSASLATSDAAPIVGRPLLALLLRLVLLWLQVEPPLALLLCFLLLLLLLLLWA